MSDQEPAAPQQVLLSAGIVYSGMIAAALVWLAWRGRVSALAESALGEHGALPAAGLGLAVGLAGASALALASRRSAGIRSCEGRVAAFLGALPDGAAVLLATSSAVAEELFFRLAVQDAFGPVAAVAAYVLLNTGPGFWPWLPVALAAGVSFAALVAGGFGLLSASIAHALINYLALRRILPT